MMLDNTNKISTIETWVYQYGDALFSWAISKTKNKELSEDLVQETYIAALKSFESFENRSQPKTWLISILNNKIIDHFRKEKRSPVITNVDGFDIFDVLGIHDESMEDKMIKEQNFDDLKTLIHLLPSEQKEVLIMRHYGDLSFKEIADLTNVSINTALGRMRYALSNLRKMITNKELVLKS